ncbi:hypothetical protein [Phenylobacterium deserti]|uniref:hypothetical protein n=1 Tax=Phenylobacterium deserti TaxID=1914756 RepID=UPI0014033995|nr:hypothetical protein [Phenylobacterium deserti]
MREEVDWKRLDRFRPQPPRWFFYGVPEPYCHFLAGRFARPYEAGDATRRQKLQP